MADITIDSTVFGGNTQSETTIGTWRGTGYVIDEGVPGEVERLGVGEDVALGERARLGVAVAQAGDAVVEQPSARLEHPV